MISWRSPRAARFVFPVAALLVAASAAQAQGTDEQREACTPDALKLCSDTIPDIPKTTACMKAHEASLSPRCRAVFNEPATKEPTVAAASRAAEATKTRRARHEAIARDEQDGATPPRHRRETMAEPYADPLRGADADAVDSDGRPAPRYGAGDAYGGPDIRRFPPGDGPDEVGAGPLPYGDSRDDGGPRYLGPPAGDGPRFADRGGPDGYDAPGWRRGGPPGLDGPPDAGDDIGPGTGTEHRSRRSARPARTVIARMCARGEIDPRTCSETMRALERRHD